MPRSDFNRLTLGTRLASDLGRARQKCLSVPYGELAYVKLVQFLAQLNKGLLYGIGFLSAFLSGAEIGFFRSVVLETTAIVRIVRRARTPMLIARSQCFSVRAFWDCGQYQVTTYLFYCCAKVSHCKKRWMFWILTGHTSRCMRVSRCEMRWTYRIFPGHIRARLPRETERANACPQESHLSREGRTDSARFTGRLVTRQISLNEGG